MSDMEEIAVSKFKATCLAVMERVRRTGRPIWVTRFGKPVAEIVPAKAPEIVERKLGMMAGTAEIVGDIDGPIWTTEELYEIEAEWLRSWGEQEAAAQLTRTRNLASAKRSPRKMRGDSKR